MSSPFTCPVKIISWSPDGKTLILNDCTWPAGQPPNTFESLEAAKRNHGYHLNWPDDHDHAPGCSHAEQYKRGVLKCLCGRSTVPLGI